MPSLLERMHALLESACFGWKGALPIKDPDESAQICGDRFAHRDLLRKGDDILKEAKNAPPP